MKGNEIIKDIIKEEIPDIEQVREKCLNRETAETPSGQNKRFIKPVMITAIIFTLLATTVAATVPMIFNMRGSNSINFFDFAFAKNEAIGDAGDYDLIKQHSSDIGITAEGNGYSFTVDNIAFDGTFLSVFYTIEKKANIIDEFEEFVEKWNGQGEIVMTADKDNAIYANIAIALKAAEYDFPVGGTQSNMNQGYFVSDNEIKAMQRFIITDDLPDIFDVEITHFNMFDDDLVRMATKINGTNEKAVKNLYDKFYKNGLSISLTIDRSESIVEKLSINPGLSVEVKQQEVFRIVPETVERNITIEKVSVSPLGNIIVMTQAGASNDEKNKRLFNSFFIVDDKGNLYRKTPNTWYREKPEEDTTFIVEFFGSVPSDTEYIKMIPYNKKQTFIYEENSLGSSRVIVNNFAEIDNLPAKIKYSDYGDVIIESAVVTDNNVVVTYRTEGMVDDDMYFPLNINIYESMEDIKILENIYSHRPVYDSTTDLYTITYMFRKPIENAQDIIKSIGTTRWDVELLEEQAIIIPLR